MSESSVEDIVRSFVDDDLSALDAFGEVPSPASISSNLPTEAAPGTPGTPITPDLQSGNSSAGFQNSETPNSDISLTSSKVSIDSLEQHYANINGSRVRATRKASTNSIGDNGKLGSKIKMFGRRIVSSSSATTSPSTISSDDYDSTFQEHTAPTINMRFSTEKPTAV